MESGLYAIQQTKLATVDDPPAAGRTPAETSDRGVRMPSVVDRQLLSGVDRSHGLQPNLRRIARLVPLKELAIGIAGMVEIPERAGCFQREALTEVDAGSRTVVGVGDDRPHHLVDDFFAAQR